MKRSFNLFCKFSCRVSILLLLCACWGVEGYGQKSLSLAFGMGNRMVYDLTRGVYSLELSGRMVIREAYAYCKAGDSVLDSRTGGLHSYVEKAFSDATGKGRLYSVSSGDGLLQQLFYVYPAKNYCMLEVRVRGRKCNYMAVLTAERVVFNGGDDSRVLKVPFDNDMYVRYDAAEMGKANFISSEVTAFYGNATRNGIIMGSLEQDVWKSGVRVVGGGSVGAAGGGVAGASAAGGAVDGGDNGGSSALTLFAGLTDSVVTHDRIPHGAVGVVREYCRSPRMLIGGWDDWRDGMEAYAKLNKAMGPRTLFSWDKPVPIVWNSWGAIQTKLTLEKVKGVIDFFHDSCMRFRRADGSLFIDLDAFWDNMTPGGIDGDVSKLRAFVDYCRQKGMRPGVYWTPFADWGKSERPIMGTARPGSGTPYRYEETWTKQNGHTMDIDGGRAMDPTHPGTRWMIVHVLGKLKELGFEMIKVDFLGHGAIEADRFYDPGVTTGMQAFRQGMALVDSVLGKSMLVYAAISPSIATSRYVHMRRIACDAFIAIDNSEYTLNSTGYGWWLGRMYNYIDADHVVFDGAPEGMNRARLASSLVTGTLTTGDDYSLAGKWRGMAQRLFQDSGLLAIARQGISFRPVEANTGNKGVDVFVQKLKGGYFVAVFNYSDKPQDYSLSLSRLGFGERSCRAVELFTSQSKRVEGTLQVRVEASDVRLYRLEAGAK